MKKPVQKFLFAALLCGAGFVTTPVAAQKLFFLFGHAVYSAPVQHDFKNAYNFGAGAEVGAGVGTNNTFFTGTLGYSKFHALAGNTAGNLAYVPVKLGVRQYMLAKLLFINANAGIANINPANGNAASRFTADAGIGLKLAGLDLGINYDGYSTTGDGWASWFAFKAGFRIGL